MVFIKGMLRICAYSNFGKGYEAKNGHKGRMILAKGKN